MPFPAHLNFFTSYGRPDPANQAASRTTIRIVRLTIVLIGGVTWSWLAPYFGSLLTNVTDSGPVRAAMDVLAGFVNPGHLLSTHVLATITNFSLGAILSIPLARYFAVSYRDQFVNTLALKAKISIDRIKRAAGRQAAIQAAAGGDSSGNKSCLLSRHSNQPNPL
ncbi:MAG TPA: hypothetical protein VF020_18625 [Chthoniobacterales bacterium]